MFPIRSANGAVNIAIDLDAHALCLAHDNTAPDSPALADKAPKADHHFAACCVWLLLW